LIRELIHQSKDEMRSFSLCRFYLFLPRIAAALRSLTHPSLQFTRQIADGDLVPSLVRESIRQAEEERPGAVHLELPEDIAKTMSKAHIFPVYQVRRPVAEEKSIAKAVAMIQAARHPLLLIGAGANRKRTQNM
jgi:acetolactate synthase-1/2/3 large subunit